MCFTLPPDESGGPFAWEELGIDVWAVSYDPETLRPTGRLLKSERFDVATH